MKKLVAILLFSLFCFAGVTECYAYSAKHMEEAFGNPGGGAWAPGFVKPKTASDNALEELLDEISDLIEEFFDDSKTADLEPEKLLDKLKEFLIDNEIDFEKYEDDDEFVDFIDESIEKYTDLEIDNFSIKKNRF